MLAEGLQHVHLIAQNAHAAVINWSGAATSPVPVTADMSIDQDANNDHIGNPVNPRLPHYTGAEDHGLWLLHVEVLFQVHQTPAAQHGLWMVTAFRGPAIRFWFVECAGQLAEQEIIASVTSTGRCRAYRCNLAITQAMRIVFPSSPVNVVE